MIPGVIVRVVLLSGFLFSIVNVVLIFHHYLVFYIFFFFNDTATTEIYTLSLHDALPIYHCNGVTSLHTYPHIDFADTGKRAIKMLTRIINDGVNPVCARIKIPALVRGKIGRAHV